MSFTQVVKVTLDTVDVLDTLKRHQKFAFKCTQCGKDVVMELNSKSRIPRYKRLLCSRCAVRVTCVERYGVSNVAMLEGTKEKKRETCRDRLGVDYAFQSDDVKQKRSRTMLDRYGVEYPMQMPGGSDVYSQTCMERYGVANAAQCEAFKEKSRQTCMDRYGVEYITQNDGVKTKIRETLMKNYGTEHAPAKRVQWNGQWFDSSWELIFYRYWSSIPGAVIRREPCYFVYRYGGKTHRYYPDFWLKKPDGSEGYYEVKGDQFFAMKEGKEVMVNPFDHSQDAWSEAKHQCAIEHGVIFVRREEIKNYELCTDIEE